MRLIGADALILAIRDYADKKCAHGEIELANGILKTLSCINNAPTIEPKRGKVVKQIGIKDLSACSACNCSLPVSWWNKFNFCPNCGANMRAQSEITEETE